MAFLRHKQIAQIMIIPTILFESISFRVNESATNTITNLIRIGRIALAAVAVVAMIPKTTYPSKFNENPRSLFRMLLLMLLSTTFFMKWHDRRYSQRSHTKSKIYVSSDKQIQENNLKPNPVKSLQRQFLPVFWLLRIAFWISGPYFYAVYASKIVNGRPMTMAMISRISLVGFISIALFGPITGRLMDQYGRKKGTIGAAILYALGALSTQSSDIGVLLLGRALGGIGTSLMGSAPEAWIISEFEALHTDKNNQWLSETFGWAFSMDSILAIAAGQLASLCARHRGPTGPFQLSPFFLVLAAAIATVFWRENIAKKQKSLSFIGNARYKSDVPSIRDAFDVVMADPKIIMLGAIQSLFESSMYIFVLLWPRAMNAAIQDAYGADSTTPYGMIFSCFMACCMIGSSVFGKMSKRLIPIERSCTGMMAVAFVALMSAAISVSGSLNLAGLIITFFVFEACVGMYFPSIGILRSRLLPNTHRAVIMTLFGVPLNLLVVIVFLSIDRIGLVGAMSVAAFELGIATACMIRLNCLRLSEK